MIKRIKVSGFRNIISSDHELSPHFNVFYGENGAGKTSLLEAIYFIAHAKSFRSRLISRVINNCSKEIILFAETTFQEKNYSIGLQRGTGEGEKRIRVNGENIASIATVSKILPIQLISVDSYRLFHDGPKARRQLLDWGLFHVKHDFLATWQQFQRVLKQRNAALKQRLSRSQIKAWDEELCLTATALDNDRQSYTRAYQPILDELLATFLPGFALKLRYQRGWKKDCELAELLELNIDRDYQLGYTQAGPQRADLMLYYNNVPVHDHLSQGQLKLAAYAIKLAQGILLKQQAGHAPLYLIDDLPSELDANKQQVVFKLLSELDTQICITGINKTDFNDTLTLHSDTQFFDMTAATTEVLSDQPTST